jgi:hypothetical protein
LAILKNSPEPTAAAVVNLGAWEALGASVNTEVSTWEPVIATTPETTVTNAAVEPAAGLPGRIEDEIASKVVMTMMMIVLVGAAGVRGIPAHGAIHEKTHTGVEAHIGVEIEGGEAGHQEGPKMSTCWKVFLDQG